MKFVQNLHQDLFSIVSKFQGLKNPKKEVISKVPNLLFSNGFQEHSGTLSSIGHISEIIMNQHMKFLLYVYQDLSTMCEKFKSLKYPKKISYSESANMTYLKRIS